MKILIAIPTRGTIFHGVASFLYHQKEKGHAIYKHTTAMSVEAARLGITRYFLDKDFTHLFFLDDDVVPPDYCIESLLDKKLPVITLNYPLIHNGHIHSSAYKEKDGHYFPYEFDEPQEGDRTLILACGLGACLIERNVIHAALTQDRNCFQMEYNDEGDMILGDDIKFCKVLKDLGIPIYCDFNLKADHYKLVSLRSIYDNYT